MRDGDARTVEREPPAGESGVDVPAAPREQTRTEQRGADSRRARVRARVAALFSVRQFLVAVGAALVGLFVVGGALPFGSLGDLLGLASGAFVHGALSGDRRYLEAVLAGGAVALGATLVDHLVLTLFGLGLPVVTLGAVGGAIAGGLGHYFGRDLRDGLTREL